MKAIFACKLYKSSKRKDKINAAIQNPVNSELVSQLAEYLDEEYQPTAVPKADSKDFSDLPSGESDDLASDSSFDSPASSHSGSSGSFHGGDLSNIPDDPIYEDGELVGYEDESESESSDDGLDSRNDSPDVSDEEVVDVPEEEFIDTDMDSASDTVEESTEIIDSSDEGIQVTQEVVDQVKSILNNEVDTAGVSRASLKDNELWLYYEDSVNLNNVMVAVIELLTSSGYDYLEFNRLARSANAIVFQVPSQLKINSVNPTEVDSND